MKWYSYTALYEPEPLHVCFRTRFFCMLSFVAD
uniref:Uncharacterized protein n=1 Tax=Arundo donax TaxID=35708 RepID=A0A0A9AL00_ARUDO